MNEGDMILLSLTCYSIVVKTAKYVSDWGSVIKGQSKVVFLWLQQLTTCSEENQVQNREVSCTLQELLSLRWHKYIFESRGNTGYSEMCCKMG